MKKIPLTRGKAAIVDDGDYDRLRKFNWQAGRSPSGNWYARRRLSSAQQSETGRYFGYMHQEVLGCGRGVDHIDGDGLNNRRENLRQADQSVNNQNKRKKSGCTSRYLGVSWKTRNQKWVAQVKMPKGKVQHLGLFTSQRAAARAYDAAVVSLYTGYVKTNFSQVGGVL